jgi:hypothetical protein
MCLLSSVLRTLSPDDTDSRPLSGEDWYLMLVHQPFSDATVTEIDCEGLCGCHENLWQAFDNAQTVNLNMPHVYSICMLTQTDI